MNARFHLFVLRAHMFSVLRLPWRETHPISFLLYYLQSLGKEAQSCLLPPHHLPSLPQMDYYQVEILAMYFLKLGCSLYLGRFNYSYQSRNIQDGDKLEGSCFSYLWTEYC